VTREDTCHLEPDTLCCAVQPEWKTQSLSPRPCLLDGSSGDRKDGGAEQGRHIPGAQLQPSCQTSQQCSGASESDSRSSQQSRAVHHSALEMG
jgi:hypothetical protein